MSDAEPRVWLFNVDADVELAIGKGYTPSRGVLSAMEGPRARLAHDLARPGDFVIVEDASGARIVSVAELTGGNFAPRELGADALAADPGGQFGIAKFTALREGAGAATGASARGRAFCPTPRAVALFQKLGIDPEPYPPVEVLRRVNGRAFCAEAGQNLLGSLFARSVEEATRVLAAAPPIGRQWRAKRAFGMAGRGQRPIAPSAVSDADVSFLRASIERDGGIQIEPEVEITRELGMHAMLARDGSLRVGRLVRQECDANGQWLASHALENDAPEVELRAEVERVASALHLAGYFGPFGIDAYEYRVDNELRFNPRSEINARYSMGFAASGLIN